MADNYLERKFEEHFRQKDAKNKLLRRAADASARKGCMMRIPEGLRVFVTGGAAGIGRCIVKTFRAAGCKVAFCDIDERAGQATAEALGAQYHPVDVTDTAALEQSMQHVADTWGGIDVVVNNAGISRFSPLEDTSPEEFDRILATNLRPAFVTSRRLAKLHRANPSGNYGGRIINIASTRALMSEPASEAYAASKGGIVALTHALAMSLSDLRITVNAISPGWIETGDYAALRPEDHSQHPSQRVGRPDDIARMCLFLCEEGNEFINGENIVIDGGMTRKMIYTE